VRRNLLLFAIVAGIVAVAAVVLWFAPKAQEARTPRLVRAWVGVEVGDAGMARTGTVELGAGESFRLHAVVEAQRGGDGEAVYYSATPRVVLDGREVNALPVEELSVLGRVRLLWFSVENGLPFREVENGADLENLATSSSFGPSGAARGRSTARSRPTSTVGWRTTVRLSSGTSEPFGTRSGWRPRWTRTPWFRISG